VVVSGCTRVAGIAKKEVIQSNTIADHLSVVSGCTRGSGIAKKEVMQFNTSIAYLRALIHLLIFVLKTIQQLKNKKKLDVIFSAHGAFLESPSSSTLKIDRLERQIILVAIKSKGL
jgi:hypothetical protein